MEEEEEEKEAMQQQTDQKLLHFPIPQDIPSITTTNTPSKGANDGRGKGPETSNDERQSPGRTHKAWEYSGCKQRHHQLGTKKKRKEGQRRGQRGMKTRSTSVHT